MNFLLSKKYFVLSTSKIVLSTICEFSANTPWQENWKLKKKTVILWYSTRHCILRSEIRNVRSSKTLYIGIFSVKSGEESAGLKCNILFVNIIKTLPIYSTQQCQLFLPKRLAVSYDDKPRRFFYSLQKTSKLDIISLAYAYLCIGWLICFRIL